MMEWEGVRVVRRESVADRQAINQQVEEEFRANGGTVGGRYAGWQLLLLTTTGAKSGQPRTVPLGYTLDGERIVLIAARGGGRHNPDWYHNLCAQPLVTVELGTERFQAWARVTTGEERERLFGDRATPGSRLAEYQQRTMRTIPVIVLERLE